MIHAILILDTNVRSPNNNWFQQDDTTSNRGHEIMSFSQSKWFSSFFYIYISKKNTFFKPCNIFRSVKLTK